MPGNWPRVPRNGCPGIIATPWRALPSYDEPHHGRKGYSAAIGWERRDMPVKRASVKSKSRRVFGHPGKRSKAALRAGLYARVSTNDQQTLPMQLRALREYAARRGWSVFSQVKEIGSGASQRQMREKL